MVSLWTQLELDPDRHRTVALVGGGGKTTLLYALAREARAAGRTVIVTTTTHMFPHPRLTVTGCAEVSRLRELTARHGIVMLGVPGREGKLSAAGTAAACMQAADLVLIEADGAKRLPLKAPADYEPVIPPQAAAVIAVAGADCVGRPIRSVCHRPERVCALLGKPPQATVEPEDAALLLASPLGGRKGTAPHMAFRCAVNKADLAPRAAQEIQALLCARGIPTLTTSFTEEERGGLCWF